MSDPLVPQNTQAPAPAPAKAVRFREDIEGLRGVAVLAVVAYHCTVSGVSGGFVGVDVFFALSGYLITGLLIDEVERTGRVSLGRFYARRVRRLMPAAALVSLVTVVAAMVLLAPNEMRNIGRAGRANAIYMSNVLFANDAADYFAASIRTNALLHTWSLAVEEQFYLVWPALIIVGFQLARSKKSLAAILFATTATSLAISVITTYSRPTFAFYSLPARAWEFGLGGLAAMFPFSFVAMPSRVWKLLSWAGLAAVLLSVSVISERMAFPGFIALLPVAGTAIALMGGAGAPGGARAVLGLAPMQWLGSLSYSWYLWHWPVLVLATALMPNISTPGKCAAAIVGLGLAAVTHALLENPVRFHPALVNRTNRSLLMGAAVMAMMLGASTGCILYANRVGADKSMRAFSAEAEHIANMQRERCVSLSNDTEPRTCAFGNDTSATRIVLFGDSHAIQWFNPIRQIAEQRGWSLHTYLKSGCPAADVEPRGVLGKGVCPRWRAAALREIQAAKPTAVVVASATTYLGRPGDPDWAAQVTADDWQAGTTRTVDALVGTGAEIMLIRDTPLAGFDVPACLARTTRHAWYPSGACDVDRARSLNTSTVESSIARHNTTRHVHFLDFTESLCGPTMCPARLQGLIVYRDENHISGTFASSLQPAVDAQLRPWVTPNFR